MKQNLFARYTPTIRDLEILRSAIWTIDCCWIATVRSASITRRLIT